METNYSERVRYDTLYKEFQIYCLDYNTIIVTLELLCPKTSECITKSAHEIRKYVRF